MATPVTDFLLALARDPGLVEKFRSSEESARQVMDAAGLAAHHQTALLSGNENDISKLVQTEIPVGPDGVRVSILCMVNRPGGP